MSSLPILDYIAGQELKQEGIARAASSAGPSWIDQAVADFVAFLKQNGPNAVETWRADYLSRGMPEPKNHKVWGAVASAAVKRGLIDHYDFVAAKSVATHGHRVSRWRLNEQ